MAPASPAADYIITTAFQNIHANFFEALTFFSLYILLQVYLFKYINMVKIILVFTVKKNVKKLLLFSF